MVDAYVRGWEDCLDVMLSVVCKSKSVDDVKSRIDYLCVLVLEKKLDSIKEDLRIFEPLF